MVAMIRYADPLPPAVAGAVARALPSGVRPAALITASSASGSDSSSASRLAARSASVLADAHTARPASPYAASSAALVSASAALDGVER